MIVRWPHHKRAPPPDQDRCDRCGATGAERATHCPGRWLEFIERTAIRNGAIDYQDGVWVARSDLASLTIEEIKEQEWYQP